MGDMWGKLLCGVGLHDWHYFEGRKERHRRTCARCGLMQIYRLVNGGMEKRWINVV